MAKKGFCFEEIPFIDLMGQVHSIKILMWYLENMETIKTIYK